MPEEHDSSRQIPSDELASDGHGSLCKDCAVVVFLSRTRKLAHQH